MIFTETDYHSIAHQFAQFKVAQIEYIIDFSSDNDVIETLFPLDKQIETLLKIAKPAALNSA